MHEKNGSHSARGQANMMQVIICVFEVGHLLQWYPDTDNILSNPFGLLNTTDEMIKKKSYMEATLHLSESAWNRYARLGPLTLQILHSYWKVVVSLGEDIPPLQGIE